MKNKRVTTIDQAELLHAFDAAVERLPERLD